MGQLVKNIVVLISIRFAIKFNEYLVTKCTQIPNILLISFVIDRK